MNRCLQTGVSGMSSWSSGGQALDSDRWEGILGRSETWVIEHLAHLTAVLVWRVHQPETSGPHRPLNPQCMNTDMKRLR